MSRQFSEFFYSLQDLYRRTLQSLLRLLQVLVEERPSALEELLEVSGRSPGSLLYSRPRATITMRPNRVTLNCRSVFSLLSSHCGNA